MEINPVYVRRVIHMGAKYAAFRSVMCYGYDRSCILWYGPMHTALQSGAAFSCVKEKKCNHVALSSTKNHIVAFLSPNLDFFRKYHLVCFSPFV